MATRQCVQTELGFVEPGPIQPYVTRYLRACGINAPVDIDSIRPDNNQTNREDFGEVFTPMALLDEIALSGYKIYSKMEDVNGINIPLQPSNGNNFNPMVDLCAGYGQFTLSVIRNQYKIANNIFGFVFDPVKYVKNRVVFNEIQPGSAGVIKYIYGDNVNLYIGDAIEFANQHWFKISGETPDCRSKMFNRYNILPERRGTWYYNGVWNRIETGDGWSNKTPQQASEDMIKLIKEFDEC